MHTPGPGSVQHKLRHTITWPATSTTSTSRTSCRNQCLSKSFDCTWCVRQAARHVRQRCTHVPKSCVPYAWCSSSSSPRETRIPANSCQTHIKHNERCGALHLIRTTICSSYETNKVDVRLNKTVRTTQHIHPYAMRVSSNSNLSRKCI